MTPLNEENDHMNLVVVCDLLNTDFIRENGEEIIAVCDVASALSRFSSFSLFVTRTVGGDFTLPPNMGEMLLVLLEKTFKQRKLPPFMRYYCCF